MTTAQHLRRFRRDMTKRWPTYFADLREASDRENPTWTHIEFVGVTPTGQRASFVVLANGGYDGVALPEGEVDGEG